MLFPGYLPTFPASILEPLLKMHTTSYMSVITYTLTVHVVERELSSNCVRSNFVFIFERRGHLSPLQDAVLFVQRCKHDTVRNNSPSTTCTVSLLTTIPAIYEINTLQRGLMTTDWRIPIEKHYRS